MNKELQQKARSLFEETQLTIQQIADELGVGYHAMWNFVRANYSQEVRMTRKVLNYSLSKTGSRNPMSGKCGDQHHNFIGVVADGRGYLMVPKPEWYTGRKGSKHVFLHSVVMCEHLGVTKIPEGFVVHHIDQNPKNNDINNLALLTIEAHGKLHSILKGVTTISKESRANKPEAHDNHR